MKVIKYTILTLCLLVLLPLLIVGSIIFFNPDALINGQNLEWVLNKSDIFKEWSWKKNEIGIAWKRWNKRRFYGQINDFCFHFENEGADVNACFPEISWNFLIHLKFGLPRIESLSPFYAESSFMNVVTKETQKKEKTPPPDIWKMWKMFWGPLIPDVQLILKNIAVNDFTLNISADKFGKELHIEALNLHLFGDPEKLTLRLPDGYELSKKLPLDQQLKFYRTRMIAHFSKSKIDVDVGGQYSPLSFKILSKIKLPLKTTFDDPLFLKSILLETKGFFRIPEIKKNMSLYSPHPYHSLPAPLNVMDGEISSEVFFQDLKKDNVAIKGETNIDLKGKKQVLDIFIGHDLPFNITTKEISEIKLSLDLREILIQLPKFSKKSIPPKFIPDSRIKTSFAKKPQKKKRQTPIHLEAMNDNPIKIKSNLLDELLRMNLDLYVSGGEVQNGWVQILPLKTKIFKRPIELKNFKITFDEGKEPFLKGKFRFPLPEYKITMLIEGPSTSPRIAFQSKPPLPQSDIYAVLLFGRPMSDLGPEDKASSTQMNQILAQGILSLSVLYFLAGSPVEYIGYDPDSKKAVAQIGLGDKNSLKVQGDQQKVSGVGVRRSLGKGWYIDTSVNQEKDLTGNSVQDYGVLLERIISY